MSGAGAPAGKYCPACGVHAALILPGQATAFCGNEDCAILSWDMTMSLEQLAANIKTIDLSWTEQS